MNILKDGVIVHRLSWRLEGDQTVCGLCDNPLEPCRSPVQQAAVVLANVLVPMRWLYAPLRSSTMHAMAGGWVRPVGGPPKIMRNTPVRVDTRTDDCDTTFTDAISRMLLENQDGGPEIIGEGTGRWHSWTRPFSTRLDCRPWAPPPGAVGSAIGGALTGGGRPRPRPRRRCAWCWTRSCSGAPRAAATWRRASHKRLRPRQEFRRRDDADAAPGVEHQQILVAADDHIRLPQQAS